MAITYGNIGGAEPSTLTFRVGTVVIARGSTNEQQEILCLGDPQTSNAIASVGNATPASNAYGLTVRPIFSSTGADNPVRALLSSTSADNPVTVSGNSTVFQGGAPWSVSQVAGSTWTVRANNSSAADLLMRPVFSSTGADNPVVITAGNSSVTITAIAAGAGRLNIGSTAADNAVLVSGNSTVVILSGNSSVIITSGNSSVIITSIASNAGRLNIGSTAADNAVLVSGNSTVFQGGAPWTVADVMQSSLAPSSNSSGLICRVVVDNILTLASSNAFTSTSLTIQSSAASIRSYVTAYSILTTNAGPTKVKFYSGSTLLWPMIFAAVSSAVSGANLAASAPAYLFRTKVAGPLSLNLSGGGSTIAGFHVAVSYFRAP